MNTSTVRAIAYSQSINLDFYQKLLDSRRNKVEQNLQSTLDPIEMYELSGLCASDSYHVIHGSKEKMAVQNPSVTALS